jgi:hypothetical protein
MKYLASTVYFASIVGMFGIMSSPEIAPIRRDVTGYVAFQSKHPSVATPMRVAGVFCYDTGYTPPRATVC